MRALILLLVVAIIIQPLHQSLLIVNYGLNKNFIAENYCINKAKPQMKCEGKCHLNKELKKSNDNQSKAPKSLKQFSDFVLIAEDCKVNDYHLFSTSCIISFFVYRLIPSFLFNFFHPPKGL